MKIRLTFDLGDEDRYAIDAQYNDLNGKAVRQTCINWIESTLTATLQSIKCDEGYLEGLQERQIKAGVLEPDTGPNDQRRRERLK